MSQQFIDLAKKIKELADRGIDGEKVSAQAKLKRIMEKYGITEEDLGIETQDWYKYFYTSTFEKQLIWQILSHVTDRQGRSYRVPGVRALELYLTPSQRVEFEFKWSVFRKSMNKQLDLFYTAFINKNNIFPESAHVRDWSEMTPEEIENAEKIHALIKQVDKAELHKRLK